MTPIDVVDVQNPFTVSLNASDGQLEKESNDTATKATPLDITRPLTGRLSSSTNLDFYTFQLDAPRFLALGFTAPDSTGSFTLALFKESDASEIDGIDIMGGQATTLHMGLGAGRYYLLVKGGASNIDTFHNYTLTFTDSPQTDLEIESNNTLRFANAIDKSQARRGRIYSAQDKDYYGFHLSEGGFLTFTFTPTTTTGSYKLSLVDENYEKTAQPLYPYTSTDGQVVKAEDLWLDPGNYYLMIEANGVIDQYKPYSIGLTSTVAIIGLKQLVNVAVTGQNQTMTVGNTQTLNAKAGYSDATITAVTPTWTSLNPSVATVNAAGLVEAKAQGTTSIVASYGGMTGKFDLTVGVPLNVVNQHYANLILVAGGGIADTNTLRESTQYLSDLVYRRFRTRLFTDEDIYYFNPLPFHDLNGDGYGENIVDDTSPTVAKFGNTITEWAKNQSTDGPLYIYLIDHGDTDSFQIFPGEILTAVQLKGFIDTFQTVKARKVVVMIEACKSGSFTNDLVSSGQDRIVVGSTSDQYQLMSRSGTDSFTQFFIDKLWEGESIFGAYTRAKQRLANMGAPYNQQDPKLVEGVNLASSNVKIGGDFIVAGAMPEFTEKSLSAAIAANTAQGLFARIDPAYIQTIEKVWAVVVPPVYEVTGSGTQTVQFPSVEMNDPVKDGKYEGSYSAFSYNGAYQITFYARNMNGNVVTSAPTIFTVTGGQNTCQSSTDCSPGSFCSKPAGACSAQGLCAPKPDACQAVYTPACGCDGKTYGNACEAALAGQSVSYSGPCIDRGDINRDGSVSLADAIMALQLLSGLKPTVPVYPYADVNNDGKIGLPEAIFILQKAAEIR